MNSGNRNKYLTPCRSFGLKRVHKKMKSMPGSFSRPEATKSVNSPFTSPLMTAGASTVTGVEKKRSLMQDFSKGSTPLINKTCLKMGLSKPKRVLQPKDLLSRLTFPNSHGEIRDNTFFGNYSETGIIPKTLMGKCFEDNPNSVHSYYPSSNELPAHEILHERCSVKTAKGSFLGWDSDSEDLVSINSRLKIFKKFSKNQKNTSSSKLSFSSQYYSCHADVISGAEMTSKNATAVDCSSSDKSSFLPENGVGIYEYLEDVTSSVDCNPNSKKAGFLESEKSHDVSMENHLVCQIKFPSPKLANDDSKHHVSEDSTVFYGEMEDETDDKWYLVPSHGPKPKTYSVKRIENGKLSISKQTSPSISKQQMKNSVCGSPVAVMRTITLAESQNPRDHHVISQLEKDAHFKSNTEELEELRTEIQKWLEGGKRVIQDIIKEVHCQKDREMAVMEVLEEQGVDPGLVGYDPQREEFVTFDKFMLKYDNSSVTNWCQ